MIRWITTTEKSPWVEQSTPTFSSAAGMPDIFIDTKKTAQSIEGFGASFNEYGWTSLAHLSSEDREEVLRALFEPGKGLNLALCRMPVAANDFSRDWYSYDEVDGDFELEHFSIANDEETLIPFINAAKRYQPNLQLWASPWSPPTWMKVNQHYAGAKPNPAFNTGSATNGLRDDQVQVEGTDNFKLEEPYLATYAKYFGKFIDEYNSRGIKISMVMPQNEFNSAQVFPSCVWTAKGLAKFIAHLGPEMEKRGVEIFQGTLERPDERMALDVIEDSVAGKYVKGVGVQWAGKGAVAYIHRALPKLRIYQSEQQCGDGKNDWRFARHVWNLMKFYFDHGTTGYMYWNMALEEGGVSRWGW
ncbi:MAG: glycoside hydrolase family 30 protein, partial [Micrococcales bacterium]